MKGENGVVFRNIVLIESRYLNSRVPLGYLEKFSDGNGEILFTELYLKKGLFIEFFCNSF